MTTNTTVQPGPDTNLLNIPPDIPPVHSRRWPPRDRASAPTPLRAATLDEIDDVEWLIGWATAEEIARAVGRSSVPALIRFLHRAERWDIAIRIMPLALNPVDAYQIELRLDEARLRAVAARAELIGWAIAWTNTRPADGVEARCAA